MLYFSLFVTVLKGMEWVCIKNVVTLQHLELGRLKTFFLIKQMFKFRHQYPSGKLILMSRNLFKTINVTKKKREQMMQRLFVKISVVLCFIFISFIKTKQSIYSKMEIKSKLCREWNSCRVKKKNHILSAPYLQNKNCNKLDEMKW